MTADALLFALADFENAFDALLVSATGKFTLEHLSEVREFVIGARDGDTPSLVDGLPRLPDWAERRQSRRVPINVDAELRRRGQTQFVRVRDVSTGGLGIEFCDGLVAGDIVALALGGGRRFVATVAWAHSDRAGLTLATRLRPCDPLLAG